MKINNLKDIQCHNIPLDIIDWVVISGLDLSEEFITLYKKYLTWNILIIRQKLSLNFIIDNFKHLTENIGRGDLLQQYHKLPEFLLDQLNINWIAVASNQNVSKSFIEGKLQGVLFNGWGT